MRLSMVDVKIDKACAALEPLGGSFSDWKILDFGESRTMTVFPLETFLEEERGLYFGINACLIAHFSQSHPDVFKDFIAFNRDIFDHEPAVFFIEEGFYSEATLDELEFGFNIDLLVVTLDEPLMIDGVNHGRDAILGMSVIDANGKCFDFYLHQFNILKDFMYEILSHP